MTVAAMGGGRLVPEPDAVARDYLTLALRLDAWSPGLVDGYSGPASLKAQVDMEQRRPAARLADDASALRERVDREVPEPDRRTWLDAQLVALETQARALAGDALPYETYVTRCLGAAPIRRDEAVFDAARSTLDGLLPGAGPLSDRLAAWDRTLQISTDRLPRIVDWLVARLRKRADRVFGLPPGEDLRISIVTGQPWGAYCWFDGGGRSRIDVNTDVPIRAPGLIHTMAHETYPGHHLEHAWKEMSLLVQRSRLESAVVLINTPECLVSEGLADLGASILLSMDDRTDLLTELIVRIGGPLATDPTRARATAVRGLALAPARRILDATRGNAALLRHAEGRSHDEVLAYLIEVGGFSPVAAAQRLAFIEHPLWRTYVFVYADGEELARRWVEAAEPALRTQRFSRLLHEQLTPSGLLADVEAQASAGGSVRTNTTRSSPGPS